MSSTKKKLIVISEFMADDAVSILKQHFNVIYEPNLVNDRTSLKEKLPNADAIIIRNRTKVDAELLNHANNLTVVGRLGVGLDNIDLTVCKSKSIQVIPATGANSRAVAEYVISTAMVLLRGAFLSSEDVANGNWPRPALSNGHEIMGKTLGIIGFGGIGRIVADLAHGLGMNVIAHDSMLENNDPIWAKTGVKPSHFQDLVKQSNIISLHIPLLPETKNMFNADVIANMQPNSILINTARGGIVDESALAKAIRDKKIGGAAIDVFDNEPLTKTPDFIGVPNLILTPHIAGVTKESNERVSNLIANKVLEFLSH